MRSVAQTALLSALALHMTATAQESAQPNNETDARIETVVLTADSLLVDESANTVTARGNVEAEYQGRVLRADSLIYNRTADTVRASGNVVILDPDGTQRFAEEFETDSTLSDGYAVGFSTRLPNGGLAIAESAIRTSDGTNALEKIVYTSCEMCEDDQFATWRLRARRAVLDEETQMYSYQDAVLEIAGIPVFYLPYFAHPDPDSDRRSGFLAPDFGTSSRLGAFYQQPFYWAISPYQDLTVSPKLMGNVNPLLELEYRKRFWSGEFTSNFSFTNERDFDSDGQKFGDAEWRGHVFARGRFDITQNWSWGFGAEQVTDDLYLRRYDIDGENRRRGLYAGQPLRLINQVYAQGQDLDWYADATFLSLEGLRENDIDGTFPSALPVLYAERLFDFERYGQLSVTGSTAILQRETGIDSQRATVNADWTAQQVLPAGFVLNPFMKGRYDYYALNDLPSEENNADRGIVSAGARLSYPLIRPGSTVDLIVEPIIMAAVGTKSPNNPVIPVEDSIFYEFDESSLFDVNAAGGYDRVEGGNRLAAGISTTAQWKNGVSLSAIAGRRWREDADAAFDVQSNLDGTRSDWVGGIVADFGEPLRFETRLRLDEEDLGIQRIDTQLSADWWRIDGRVRYYKINGDVTTTGLDDEGVALSGQFRLTDELFFVYGRQRDISGRLIGDVRQSGRDLRHVFGLAYEDDCSRFEITFERSEALDRTIGPNDALMFKFSLKTLGEYGDDDDWY